jgi:arginyl-tRNA--protein-N-Asp/Glu arginylyltransferase
MTASNDDESFLCWSASPAQMDELWAEGWRHFGTIFLRYGSAIHGGKIYSVLPLRVDIERFVLSRSQKRILARNKDTELIIRPSFVDEEKTALFEKHRLRFDQNTPTSLYNFLSEFPDSVPCPNLELCVYRDRKLCGVTFLDIGERCTSGVYAMFDPAETKRSLGILMILHSIQFSRERGCRYYYPGYAYHEPFAYDYKKRFTGLQYLDWQAGWKPYGSGPVSRL